MIDASIRSFIGEQSCATVAVADEQGHPYCFNCFYTLDAQHALLIFKSSEDPHHSRLLRRNPVVAGTILPDKINKLRIMGAQFEGMLLDEKDPLAAGASSAYHQQHPYALVMPGSIWTIRIDHIKMTDNKLGIGNKLNWYRNKG